MVCNFPYDYRFNMHSSTVVQPALGCRDISVELFFFHLLGNMHGTNFILWGLHLSSVISDPKSIDGVGFGA